MRARRAEDPRQSKVPRFALGGAAVLALGGLAAVATFAYGQLGWILGDSEVGTTGVTASALSYDPDTEELFRISPDNGSVVSYRVEERLAGSTATAVGTTGVVAGDIVINSVDATASRIGGISVNVEMFTSDSNLRDKRIRHDYLESTHYPVAIFEPTQIEGLPTAIDEGQSVPLTVSGQLLVKEKLAPVSFTGTAALDGDTLTASMSTIVKMSDFDVGPINLSGLVHTADEVELTFDLVANRVDDREQLATDVATIKPVAAQAASGAFAATVQPILEARCVSCHTIGGPGHSTVSLDTAGDAADIASGIALVVDSGYMPPWPASDLGVRMKENYSLSDEEYQTLLGWAQGGGGIDVPPETVLTPSNPPFSPIEEDLDLAPAEPYTGSLDKKNDYRCVIVDVPDPEGDGTWIKGLHFRPDRLEIVHHSTVSMVFGESRAAIEQLDAAEPGSGFTCYAPVTSNPGVIGGRIGGWTPGQQPQRSPDGYAVYLPPGAFLINQIHYHFDHENPPDQSRIVLDTVPSDEVLALAAAGTPLKQVNSRPYLTPAEGPCTPEETGPMCDRNAVLQQITEQYGFITAGIPNGLIALCGGTLEDYAKLDGTKFRSSCDLDVTNFGRLYLLAPHMHELGSAYRMTLNPDTPEERILVDIPVWSFEWQLNYLVDEEVRLDPGDKLRIECEWDRSVVAMPEPRYITWSDGTEDEMCFTTVAVMPD